MFFLISKSNHCTQRLLLREMLIYHLYTPSEEGCGEILPEMTINIIIEGKISPSGGYIYKCFVIPKKYLE